jgi:hypothetical protein
MPYSRHPQRGSTREHSRLSPPETRSPILLPRVYPEFGGGTWALDLDPDEAKILGDMALRTFMYLYREPPHYDVMPEGFDADLADKVGAQLHILGFDHYHDFQVGRRSVALSSLYRVTRPVVVSDSVRRLHLPDEMYDALRTADINTVNQARKAVQGYALGPTDPDMLHRVVDERLDAFGLLYTKTPNYQMSW